MLSWNETLYSGSTVLLTDPQIMTDPYVFLSVRIGRSAMGLIFLAMEILRSPSAISKPSMPVTSTANGLLLG
jgi:hypothetical protein